MNGAHNNNRAYINHYRERMERKSPEFISIIKNSPNYLIQLGFGIILFWILGILIATSQIMYPTIVHFDGDIVYDAKSKSMTIVTKNSSLERLEFGQKALIRISQFPFEQYGFLKATVSSSRTTANPYSIVLNLTNGLNTSNGKVLPIIYKSTGEVDVTIYNESVLEHFYKNSWLKKIFGRNTFYNNK